MPNVFCVLNANYIIRYVYTATCYITDLPNLTHCLRISPCTGGQILGVPRAHRRERDSELATNRVEDQENRNTLSGDELYLGCSGDPWESVSSSSDCHYKYPRQARSSFSKHSAMFNNSWTKQISWLDAGRHLRGARFKRGVIHLYNMVVCATGCNPLDYKGYGCYCGFLGSGYTIDGIDRCCKMHDWCYDATECPMFLEYFVPYYWKCHRGYKPICAIEHGEWGSSGSCAQRLCECDRSLAECLSRYPCPKTKAMCMSSPWRLVQNLFMNF
ncbi:uncharacterized protein LOC107272955 isoform X2 [Cephus cinctus]|uniref:Phospholipase A2 n=1 Tax=Cephus cinctus TaxID=211228 RepID=A0AAJ7CB56_CEPCN|nr:uncharacterized protein LOC107272955 isoform X2 [Cephus cinctus]